MCDEATGAYYIFQLDPATQNWINTGVVLDNRLGTKTDVLWDDQPLWHSWVWNGTPLAVSNWAERSDLLSLRELGLASKVSKKSHLYVVSHKFTTKGQASNSFSHWGRLSRYSYDSVTKRYSRDRGFPVDVTQGKSEALTVAKDSTGQLWVTFVEDNKVMINHSNSSDTDWGEPFVLPVSNTTNLTDDDISAVVAFAGRIGVMWSNQNTNSIHFAVHRDGTPEHQWQSEVVYTGGRGAADDHIDLKTDDEGDVYAVVKTSFVAPSDPLVVLLACQAATGCLSRNDWRSHTVYQVKDDHSRPTLLIDTENRDLHVFTVNSGSGGEIHRKVTSMDRIRFAAGDGEPFIRSSTDEHINNVTSTKQTLNNHTGLVVLGSDHKTRYYLHNYVNLPGVNSPVIKQFTSDQGLAGTEVTISGNNLNGVTKVGIGTTPVASFTIESDTRLRAVVPADVPAGKIWITNSAGTAFSVANFIKPDPLQ